MAHHKTELVISKTECLESRNPHRDDVSLSKFACDMITFDHKSAAPFKSERVDRSTQFSQEIESNVN